MNKKEVAAALNEIALLMELCGENPFKVRSYTNGARVIEQLDADIEDMVREKRLRELKGVGEALEQKIEELVTTGKLGFLEELRAKFPVSLYELFGIPSLGPKRIKQVYEELGIDSLAKLEEACQSGQLLSLKGFSEKLQDKILEGIGFAREHTGQHLLNKAEYAAEELLHHLRECEAVTSVEIAGSVRRGKEVIKDVDLVASSERPAEVMKWFVSAPDVKQVTGQGETKSSVVLDSGIAADLRVVDQVQFPFALLHFTGSKDHNVALRQRARERGLKLNEYGLFDEHDQSLACGFETDIYKELGLPYIAPELREDYGECQAERLPKLVELSDLRGLIHCHSTYSDGKDTLEKMALAARKLGYEYLVITDHSQTAAYAGGLRPERVRKQHEEIDRLNKKSRGFRILKGIESDIRINGELDYDEDVLKTFDVIVASVHNKLDMPEKEATARVVRAIENPYITILGHATGRLLLARAGLTLDMNKVFDACLANQVAIEINADCRRLDLDWRQVIRGREKGVMFSIGPDAHSVNGLDNVRYGVSMARKGWLEAKDVLNTLSAKELLAWRK
ncbi:MAG: DNA polymerase/3'-5' exonuclease PolX [Candidatus Hydrogenedentes bacterium]|nr:DNA polymerase/3'-5' exonuclease PolX [Candidatus Hydrogenedentota bacterium]